MYIVRPHIWEFRQPAIKTPYIRYLRCLLGRFLQRSLAWDLFRHLWLTQRRPYTTRFRHHLGLHPLEISLLNFIFHFIILSIIYYFYLNIFIHLWHVHHISHLDCLLIASIFLCLKHFFVEAECVIAWIILGLYSVISHRYFGIHFVLRVF